jgi:hypothetical protein
LQYLADTGERGVGNPCRFVGEDYDIDRFGHPRQNLGGLAGKGIQSRPRKVGFEEEALGQHTGEDIEQHYGR